MKAAGRLDKTASPIMELNPSHPLIRSLAKAEDEAIRADCSHLLYETARVLDGEKPSDPIGFSTRLNRLLVASVGKE